MADPRILVTSESDLRDIIEDKARLRKETEALAQKLGVEARELKDVERELNRTARAEEKVRREAERLRREGIEANTRALERSRVAAATWAGSWVNDIGDVAEAAIALGPVLGTVAAAGALAVGGVAIGAGVVYAWWELAFAAEGALNKLDEIPEALRPVVHLTEEEQEASRRLTVQLESLDVQFSALTAEIGGRFAPAVGDALAVTDTGIRLFREWWPEIRQVSDGFVQMHVTLASLVSPELKRVVDLSETGLRQIRETSTASSKRAQVEATLAKALGHVADAQAKIEGGNADADRAARRAAAKKAEADAARELAALERDLARQEAEEETSVMLSLDRELDAFQRAQADKVKAAEKAAKDMERVRKEEEKAAERAAAAEMERLHLHQDAALAGVTAARKLVGALTENADAVLYAKTAEALAYQAVAVARALAEGGIIAGVPAALGFVGIIGGAIAEARAAPRHMGGAMAPDEGIFRVRDGEAFQAVPEDDPVRTRRERERPILLALDERLFRVASERSSRADHLYTDRRRYAAVG